MMLEEGSSQEKKINLSLVGWESVVERKREEREGEREREREREREKQYLVEYTPGTIENKKTRALAALGLGLAAPLRERKRERVRYRSSTLQSTHLGRLK